MSISDISQIAVSKNYIILLLLSLFPCTNITQWKSEKVGNWSYISKRSEAKNEVEIIKKSDVLKLLPHKMHYFSL